MEKVIKCTINAPGCQKKFLSKHTDAFCCKNLECLKIRRRNSSNNWMKNNPEKQKRLVQKYRSIFKSVNIEEQLIKRVCIGVFCRSEKYHMIPKGLRMCKKCTDYISDKNDNYSDIIFINKKK